MPYLSGGDLDKFLEKHKQLHETYIKFFATQIVIAIGYLHERDIIHCDIKLQNIMLCDNGYLKLIDFGVSRITERGQICHTRAGTQEYMAPEML